MYTVILMNQISYESNIPPYYHTPLLYDNIFKKHYGHGIIASDLEMEFTTDRIHIGVQSVASIIPTNEQKMISIVSEKRNFHMASDQLDLTQRMIPITKNEFAEMLLTECLGTKLLSRLEVIKERMNK